MFFIDNFLLLAYLVAVFALNLFIYMIAEYYRKKVDNRLNPTGFVISMCAISVAIGASFIEDKAIFTKIMILTLSVASIARFGMG